MSSILFNADNDKIIFRGGKMAFGCDCASNWCGACGEDKTPLELLLTISGVLNWGTCGAGCLDLNGEHILTATNDGYQMTGCECMWSKALDICGDVSMEFGFYPKFIDTEASCELRIWWLPYTSMEYEVYQREDESTMGHPDCTGWDFGLDIGIGSGTLPCLLPSTVTIEAVAL